MIIKKNRLVILLSVSLLFSVSSCKYYDEGPGFSLRSRLTRIANDWAASKILEDNKDVTSDYKTLYVNYLLSLKKDKTYRLSYRLFNITDYFETGTWDCSSDDKELILKKNGGTNNNNNGVANTWQIIMLKDKEMWVKQKQSGGEVLELHLKPN